MKSKIDQLEQILQRLIESSTAISRKSEREKLFQSFVSAIMEQITADANQFSELPTTFSIQLHPITFVEWQSDKELIEVLILALQEAAVEAGLFFSVKPSIFLEADPDLDENELRVFSIQLEKQGTKTAILSPTVADAQPKTPVVEKRPFLILENGMHFPLTQSVINIGRRESNELVIEDLHISRDHAQIRCIQRNFVIFDLNSKGGTFVNGRKIVQYVLKPGDVISLSGHPIIYVEENDDKTAQHENDIVYTTRMETPSEESENKE